MIIDFHTHIFPDKIAKKTIEYLAQKGSVTPYSDGAATGLLDAMVRAGIDMAVTLPVLTRPEQFDSINRFAAEINQRFDGKQILSFAGIHPHCESIDEKMAFIHDSGFKGVKIHPDYQGVFIDDPGYIRILEIAREMDLVVVTHAGVDTGFRDQAVKCPPELMKKVIRKIHPKKLVLAHLGGCEMHESVYEHLCGEDVYLDTAFILPSVGKEMFCKILDKHGSDRILFATDHPWRDPSADLEILRGYELDTETEERILFNNAKALLNL